MNTVNNVNLLERIHSSILHKRTGTRPEFAKKLGVSESTLHRIINDLRDQGAIIKFDHSRKSYVYENEVEITFLLKIEETNKAKNKNEGSN